MMNQGYSLITADYLEFLKRVHSAFVDKALDEKLDAINVPED